MSRKTEKRLREVFDEKSLEKKLSEIDNEIDRLLSEKEELRDKSKARIEQVKDWEDAGEIRILGHMGRDGRSKYLMFIIRYPDGTQKNMRWVSNKIAELRKILSGLKEKYHGDWSDFTEELC